MVKFDIVPLECFYLKINFIEHQEIKNKLLECFDKVQETKDSSAYGKPNAASDDYVYKLDWLSARNSSREWVTVFAPHLHRILFHIRDQLGYGNHKINELWFQQYKENSKHGWHTHGSNFTFVYYVELPEDAPITQLIEPHSGRVIQPDVKEGDMILFPSYVIHRAPLIKTDTRKTIISSNIDLDNPSFEKVKELNALADN